MEGRIIFYADLENYNKAVFRFPAGPEGKIYVKRGRNGSIMPLDGGPMPKIENTWLVEIFPKKMWDEAKTNWVLQN